MATSLYSQACLADYRRPTQSTKRGPRVQARAEARLAQVAATGTFGNAFYSTAETSSTKF